LERERVAVEIVFRERDDDGDWLVWVMIHGRWRGVDRGLAVRDRP
jgi:hypothetical protein